MQPWEDREKHPKWNYVTIYYDIETTQCDPYKDSDSVFEHKPNLLVSQACVTSVVIYNKMIISATSVNKTAIFIFR